MEITKREKDLFLHLLDELLRDGDRELNKRFGSITIEEMHKAHGKLKYADFCERHGIAYEDMTDLDFEQAYREEWES